MSERIDPKSIAYELIQCLQDSSDIDNPMPGHKLVERFGLRSTSEIREVVNWLRSKGDPIVSLIGSDVRGYYWLRTSDQAAPTYAQLLGRIRSIDEAYRGLKRAFRKSEDQVELSL